MSTAAVEADDAVEAPAPAKGKKKLIIIIAAAVLVLGLGGGGAAFFMSKKKAAAAAAAAESEDGGETANAAVDEKRKERPKHPPMFVPLDPFTVNLADKESDRFAQIGITLEVKDNKAADEIKAYMPAIRNGILMVLAHKTSQQLLTREGKAALAKEVLRESMLPLGVEVSATADEETKDGHESDNPVSAIHFSTFIVQ